MSEITSPRSAGPRLSAGVAVGLALATLAVQWRFPALSPLALVGFATLIVAGLALMLLRQARRESALMTMLRQEMIRRGTAETALRQARNLAAVGRLTRGLAHDFNNHLTAVSGNVELLARRLPGEAGPLLRLVEGAMQGVRRAAALTQHLLSLSSNDSEEPEPLDLNRLVGGVAKLLHRTLGERVVLETVLSDRLWLAWADASQVEWALLDMALNARDAMPNGGTLRIETANLSDDPLAGPGGWVMLAVSGGGMMAPANPDPAASVAGSRVRVVHSPGQSSTVQLYLPRHVMRPVPRQVTSAALHRARTILLVEDDDQVRTSVADSLRDLGYEVLQAPDAMEGCRLVADGGGIDLLFTDIGLPGGVDGKALADAARNLMPELKVLFTTGYARSSSLTTGNDGTLFLAKPFSLEDLAAKVSEALSMQSPAPVLTAEQG